MDFDSVKILFVGNSQIFVNNVPGQLQAIAKSYNVDIKYKDISKHGNRGGTLPELTTTAISEMQNGKYDYIILQDHSRRPINNADGFFQDIKVLCSEIRKNGAIPVLYNPAWANINGKPDIDLLNICTEVYKRAADENGAILINAADAWIYAYQTIPGILLYTKFDPRGPHANKAGAFLTACLFATTLFDLHIEEIPRNNVYKGNNAINLANAAWDFVQRCKSEIGILEANL